MLYTQKHSMHLLYQVSYVRGNARVWLQRFHYWVSCSVYRGSECTSVLACAWWWAACM